jgi:hypothetical protein
MAAVATKTAGRELTDALRGRFHIGPRTRNHRKNARGRVEDLHEEMTDLIEASVTESDGSDCDQVFRAAWGVFLSYEKHYLGFRMNPLLRRHIELMTPWQFSALLGEMLDAGVTNTGQGEEFFRLMAERVLGAR